MFTITDFNPFDTTDEVWEEYFDFCKIVGGNQPTKNEFKEWTKESFKGNINRCKLIYQDNVLVSSITSFSKKRISGDEIPGIALESIINESSKDFSGIVASAILQLT